MAGRKVEPASPSLRSSLARSSDRPAIQQSAGRLVLLTSQDGLRLGGRVFDAPIGSRLPLLCLPGLSRNSRDFLQLGEFFSRHAAEPRRVVALDYRGRGFSDRDPNWRNYTPLVEAQDVLAATAALGVERAVVVGTSRGGIIAMFLAALRPSLLAGVVLNDIGPVIEGTGLTRIRKHLSTRHRLDTWDQAIAAAQEFGRSNFPALNGEDWRAYAQAFYKETPGGLVAEFDPNLMRAFGDASVSERVPVLWPQFEALYRIPVLAIRGERSDILSARTLSAMAEKHPRLEQLTVQGQGHAPLLRDQATLEHLSHFARRCEQSGPARAKPA